MAKKGNENQIRVVAVGDGAVGKTCLLTVFKGDPFPEDYEPTIFENHHETREYEGKKYVLHLWDTAGQEEYDRLRPMSYAKCDVLLVCFALNDQDTLNNVTKKWLPEIAEYAPKAVIILVGTKSDMWKQGDGNHCTQAKIDQVVKSSGAFKQINCSAKKGDNVTGVFDLAIQASLARPDAKCLVS